MDRVYEKIRAFRRPLGLHVDSWQHSGLLWKKKEIPERLPVETWKLSWEYKSICIVCNRLNCSLKSVNSIDVRARDKFDFFYRLGARFRNSLEKYVFCLYINIEVVRQLFFWILNCMNDDYPNTPLWVISDWKYNMYSEYFQMYIWIKIIEIKMYSSSK